MKLLQGDCIEQLRRLPEDVRADICLCDPPYSSGGLHAGDRKANTTAKYTDNDFNGAANKEQQGTPAATSALWPIVLAIRTTP